jgi:hypothetical protein
MPSAERWLLNPNFQILWREVNASGVPNFVISILGVVLVYCPHDMTGPFFHK